MSFRLGIARRDVPGGVRVDVDGELDAHTVRLLLRTLDDCVDSGSAHVEVDLGGVDFLDSTAALALVDAADGLAREDGVLRVVGASEVVVDVLRVADPGGRLGVVDGSPIQRTDQDPVDEMSALDD